MLRIIKVSTLTFTLAAVSLFLFAVHAPVYLFVFFFELFSDAPVPLLFVNFSCAAIRLLLFVLIVFLGASLGWYLTSTLNW